MPLDARELFYMFPRANWPLTPVQLQDAIAVRSDSTVFILDEQVSGFANFYQWEQGGSCTIGNVVVASSVRRKGLGTYIVNTMCNLALHHHCAREIHISCFNMDTPALLLYTRLGFSPCAVEPRIDKSGNAIALIHLRRYLLPEYFS